MRTGTFLKGASLLLLALLLVLVVTGVSWPEGDMDTVTNEDVAWSMFGTENWTGYSLIVFLIGVLLFVALLGGIFLAKEEKE